MSNFHENIFKEIINNYEKFFVHLMPHPKLIIGSRGLIGEETKNGIVLVFSSYSYDKMNIDDEAVTVNMKFSGNWESLYVPLDAISAIFNDPVKPEFMFSFKPQNKKHDTKKVEPEKETPPQGGNVITFKPRK